jgi:hypothetical protein
VTTHLRELGQERPGEHHRLMSVLASKCDEERPAENDLETGGLEVDGLWGREHEGLHSRPAHIKTGGRVSNVIIDFPSPPKEDDRPSAVGSNRRDGRDPTP